MARRERRPVRAGRIGVARRSDKDGAAAGWAVEGAGHDAVAELMARDALRDHIDVLTNKLAAIIVNAELLTQMVGGEAGDRAAGVLRSAHGALATVSSLRGCLR